MAEFLLITQLASTWTMVGVIWFVQIVHYPMFADVGEDQFAAYEAKHQRLTTWVVGPPMLVEALTATWMIWELPAGIPLTAAIVGLALVAVIWISTAALQVPAHQRLSKQFDPATGRWLVTSNWIRTIAWTCRGLLVGWMVYRMMTPEAT